MISMCGSHSLRAPRRSSCAVDLVALDLIAFEATQDERLGPVGGLDSQRQVGGFDFERASELRLERERCRGRAALDRCYEDRVLHEVASTNSGLVRERH